MSISRRSVTWGATAGLALSLLGMTACTPEASPPSTDGRGSGGPGTSAPSFEDTESSAAGSAAPKVANPLDATRFVQSPCSILTPAQVAPYGVRKGRPGTVATDSVGPSCSWSNPDEGSGIGVNIFTAITDGLNGAYSRNAAGNLAYFEPTVIDGYPAVSADVQDARRQGTCQVIVALNDKLTVGVSRIRGKPDQACSDASDIAADVIRTVKGSN